MLRVTDLIVRAGNEHLLGPVSFSVAPGQSLVIMGESGAGKSLIANAVMGNLAPALNHNGKITIDNHNVTAMSSAARQSLWGRHITLLPQEPWLALDPLMRVSHQVEESHRLVGDNNRNTAKQLTQRDFARLELDGAQTKRPDQLSGGMNQRVAFAAAMAGGATLLLADEPTKGLDAPRAEKIVDLLLQSVADGASVVVITHDITVAQRFSGQLLVLQDGQCIEHGQTNEVLQHPSHAYTRLLVNAQTMRWSDTPARVQADTVLKANGLVVGHEKQPLIGPIDFELQRGDRIAVTGPSGIGKTTLLDTLAGLRSPLDGQIERAGAVGNTGIQKIYQDPPAGFAQRVSLQTSLQDVCHLHRIDWDEMTRLLQLLGVDEPMLLRRPGEVSGGELQRIAIARALAVKPDVLLADEPTSRLDPVTQRSTMALLADVTARTNTAVVLVTHDASMANRWANRVLALAGTAGAQ